MPAEIYFEGRLTAEPDLRQTGSGVAVANFTVANNKRVKDAQTGEWSDGDPMFMRCVAWRNMATNIADNLGKGDLVIVRGTLDQKDYEKDGQKRVSYEVTVEYIGQSLRWKRNDQPKAASSFSDDVPF